MSLTKLQIRTAVREYLDDTGAKTWSDSALDVVIQMTSDGLWGDILDMAPYWNTKYEQLASPYHVPGYLDLRNTTDGGDLAFRLYRIQKLIADGREYFAKDSRDYLLTAAANTGLSTITAPIEQAFTYELLGDQLWMHPLGTTAAPGFIELRYSYRPSAFTALANGDPVPFPDGCEHCLVLQAAAHGLLRGDQENPDTVMKFAEIERNRLFATIRRKYHGPTVPFQATNPIEMGSI